jgi:hypothetical protein
MTTINHSFKYLRLATALAATTLGGCISDQPPLPEPETKKGEIRIAVDIPAQTIPSTRSMDGDKGEATIETVDVLVFRGAGAGEPQILSEHVEGINISQQTGSNHRVVFMAEVTADPDAVAVAVVANAHRSVETAIATLGTAPRKVDLFAALTFSAAVVYNNPADLTRPVAGVDYSPIPMYGEATVAGIKLNDNIKGINLVRGLARVDVINSAPDFVLEKIWLYANEKGYIAPAWIADNGEPDPSPTEPMPLPASLQGSISGREHNYDNGGAVGEIYVCESAKKETFLVLEGHLAGDVRTWFYRVDFVDPNTVPGADDDQFLPVWRNHLYRVEVTKAEGRGYLTRELAAAAESVMSNLKTTLHVVNRGEIKNIVFDGQHFLGLDRFAIEMPNLGGVATVRVLTNFASGWSLPANHTEYIGSETGWLTVKPASGDPLSADLVLNATAYSSPNGKPRQAWVYMTAGRLLHKVKVTQMPVAPN